MDHAEFSRRLAGLVNLPPKRDLSQMTQTSQDRVDVITEINTGKVAQFEDFSEDLQARLRRYPRFEITFGSQQAE